MHIEEAISTLLYQHDCVIVPGFGGFVTNYKPATIHVLKNRLNPPSKAISFNKNLINNDGLLANFIAKETNIPFNDAMQKIEVFVQELKQTLNHNQVVQLNKIGNIKNSADGKLLFEPNNTVNYNTYTFGLTPIQAFPVTKQTVEEKVIAQIKEHSNTTLTSVQKTKPSRKWIAAAAITIPFLFLAIWIPSKYNLGQNFSYTNLNPFSNSVPNSYKPTNRTLNFNQLNPISLKDAVAQADNETYYLSHAFLKNEQAVTIQINEPPKHKAEAVSTYVANKKINLRYHVVGGCFAEYQNAQNFVNKLTAKGFDAWIIGKRKGLYTVSYNSFETKKEAKNALTLAKADNAKAWILKQ